MKKLSIALLVALLTSACTSGAGNSFLQPQNFSIEPPVHPEGDN